MPENLAIYFKDIIVKSNISGFENLLKKTGNVLIYSISQKDIEYVESIEFGFAPKITDPKLFASYTDEYVTQELKKESKQEQEVD